MTDQPTLFTIGHSTLALEDFIERLTSHGIQVIADVRRFPASRRHPQFGKVTLSASLSQHAIRYEWFEDLGGRRSSSALSETNAAWRVQAFHAYADYLSDPRFLADFARLETVAAHARTAVMCAEALWTKCHRRLIADAAVAGGWSVQHIMGTRRIEPHALPVFARVRDGRVEYPRTPDPPVGDAQTSLFGADPR